MRESIASKYAAKSVFITGCTGFLGKILLEKLLYSCPDIENIYVLLRPIKDLSAEQRLENIKKTELFNRITSERPNDLKKVKLIKGDILQPRLGLNEEDEQLLIDSVSFVFHSAATIRFMEPLDIALKTNVKGTEKVLNLCLRMKNIQALVYVSTAYANAEQPIINEVLYPPPVELKMVDQLIETANQMDPQYITREILAGKPNTYTFSKSLAENLVAEKHDNVPLVIVRPSIGQLLVVVSGSTEYPVPGWIDKWQGVSGIMMFIMKGFSRCVFGKPTNILDVIPVDYVCNLMIVAAAECQRSKEVSIYHACSSYQNPLRIKELGRLAIADSVKYNFNDLPRPSVLISESKVSLYLTKVFLEKIPAALGDLWLRIMRKEPKLRKALKRLSALRRALEYFTARSWTFNTQRSSALALSLSASDKREFPFEPSSLNWNEYLPLFCGYIRENLMKISKS